MNDIIKLLTKIYYDIGETSFHIVTFYERESIGDINLSKFIKVCEKNLILNHPCILFQFLDTMGIKIAILPVINTDYWSFRIYDSKNIIITSDISSRRLAVLESLEKAFLLYNKQLKKTETNGNH